MSFKPRLLAEEIITKQEILSDPETGLLYKWSGVWSGLILFVTHAYMLLKQHLTRVAKKVVRVVRVQNTLSRMCACTCVRVTLLVYQTIIKSALTTLTNPLLAGGFTLTTTLTAFGHPDHRGII